MIKISIKKVRKRDGRIVNFGQEKITEAVWKAAQAVGGKDRSIAEKLSDKVAMQLEKSFKNRVPSVEDVQDIVEKILIEEGHAKTAKAYILYREKHKEMRDVKQLLIDSQEIVRDYIAKEDWRVYENANISYNFSGLLWHAAGTVMAYYGLNYLYPKEISNAHINGDLHLHNLSMSLAGYSFYRNETVIVRNKEKKILCLGLEHLYNLVDAPVIEKDGFEIKYSNDFEILDEKGFVPIVRVLRHKTDKSLLSFNATHGHNLIVTEDHPFITLLQEKSISCPNCKSEKVIKNRTNKNNKDYFKCKKCDACFGKFIEKIDLNLRQDLLANTINNNNYIITPSLDLEINDPPSQIDTDDGWFIGFFLAEGWKDKHRISFQLKNKSKEYEKLANYLKNKKIKYKEVIGRKISDSVEICINNTERVNYLKELGVRDYAENKNLPVNFLEMPEKIVGAMISGIIDGDGIVRNDDKWVSRAVIRLTSKTLLSQIQYWLNLQNIKSSLCTIKGFGGRRYKNLKIVPSKQLYSLTFFIPKDKKELFSSCLKIDGDFKYSKQKLKPRFFSEIRKIEEIKNDSDYVYDITTNSHTFLCNGILVHNCAGWSLRQLLHEGFNGVPGKVECSPPRHLRSAIGQMINFIGTLQNEWAGAQAFSSFDTYLAPFVRADKLSYKEIKQAIQEFVYNMNIASRWGGQCVSSDTEALTENGWKTYEQITNDDKIATFKDGKIEYLKPERINVYDYDGNLICLKNRCQEQLVTPNHLVLRKKFNSKKFELIKAGEIAKFKTPVIIPITAETNSNKEIDGNLVKLFAWLVSEGTFSESRRRVSIYQSEKNSDNCNEIRKILKNLGLMWDETSRIHGFAKATKTIRFRLNQESSRKVRQFISEKRIPTIIKTLNKRQIKLFLDTYIKGDGHIEPKGRIRIYTKDLDIKNQIQELCVLCGYGTTNSKSKNDVWIVNIIRNHLTNITKISETRYEGKVWCPTTGNGTFIARRKGKAFVTGNSPFTNITLDLTPAEDLKKQAVTIGGKLQNSTYADYQDEMDMINKALIEVMTEGDSKGRVFTFPIPTYNITKDFDWNSEISGLLFEMAAKYGLPYFQNFVNSDLKPSDVRAMCLHPNEKIIIKNNHHIKRLAISELIDKYSTNCNSKHQEEWSEPKKEIMALSLNPLTYKLEWVKIKNFLKIKGNKIVTIKTKDGKEIRVSDNHPVAVYTKEGIKTKLAKDINKEDILITTKNARNVTNKIYEKIEDLKLDEELAYFTGLFVAEGNYLYERRKYRNFGKAKGLQFSFNLKEEDYIKAIEQISSKLNLKVIRKKDPRYNTVYCYIYNTEFANKLSEFFKKKGKLPDILFNSPVSVIESFLRGFFDGEGYKKGNEIHINDAELAEDIVLLFSFIGKPVTFGKRKNSQVIRIQHVAGRGSKKELIKNDILYNRIPQFVVTRGKDKPFYKKEFMVSLSAIEKHNAHTEESSKLIGGDFATVKVAEKEIKVLQEPIDFYDIELEKNNLFVHSLGNITHNCCRLQLNLKELRKNVTGGLFGSGESTGSIGVVTINLPRIGYLSKTEEQFFEMLDRYMYLAMHSLEIKRKMVQRNIDRWLLPYTKRYLGTLKNHFATIGLVGMNEACSNFLKQDIATAEGQKFAIKVLRFMRDKLKEYQQETGHIYNLEATPAEGTAYRLAKKDRQLYPDIITQGDKEPYYTNSTHLPVFYTDDLFFALKHQEPLQTLYTGGTILHAFLGERIQGKQAKILVKKMTENFKLPYFTLTPTFSICSEHGYLNDKQEKCPRCGRETEVYSRVVGYLRPVRDWNLGKQSEWQDRKTYAVEKAVKAR